MEAATTSAPLGALQDDLRGIDLAHSALDELRVPRTDERGRRYTLLGRIEQLRAGKFDPARISRPTAAPELHRCGACGLYALSQVGDACPSCDRPLE
jgi:rubrerythrin